MNFLREVPLNAGMRRAALAARLKAAANGTKVAMFRNGKVVLEEPFPLLPGWAPRCVAMGGNRSPSENE